MRWVVEAGPAALTTEDNFGETPFVLACAHQPPETVLDLLERQPENLYKSNHYGYHPLFAACLNDDDGVVQCLVEKAPHLVHTPGEYDTWMPLMYACCHGATTETVRTLLRFHSSALNDVDDDKRNPLHAACGVHGSHRIVETLVAAKPSLLHRADVSRGWTPLHAACYHNNDQDTILTLLRGYTGAALSLIHI